MTRPRDAQAFLASLEALECVICSEPFDASHPAIMLECRHIFGEQCLKEWVERDQNTCPTCRRPLYGEEEAVVPPTQPVEQPPVEALTDVMSVLSQNSGWRRRLRVARRMNWLVSRSGRLVTALRQLPGQARVISDLLRRNLQAQSPNTTRHRNRLQRNPQHYPQVQENRRTAESLQALYDGRYARQTTDQGTNSHNGRSSTDGHSFNRFRNRAQPQRDYDGAACHSGRQNPTPIRARHSHRGNYEQTRTNRTPRYRSPSPPDTMFPGFDFARRADGPFHTAFEPGYGLRYGGNQNYQSPFDTHRVQRRRPVTWDSLFDLSDSDLDR